mmetsp:Transcript_24506/g.68292  ORF Transcript_24506/g.68292 Transcript_24506/m.68292 type:complete len:995 (-) Transcript_24506:304-3288(-)|eukprot:CAMPEP_0198108248 /NCGR_PEP_ID=MMETSP1442-20131203/305_1 /TAXON_ID= /ORGANISM="Craspedostauros australis, Strain CCMP3328" /LENGTH=994 /DNA_ID=CAMNT_0043763477 /DNA_START=63 /DNA_END=3047 /DNA_ORIENTATION=-
MTTYPDPETGGVEADLEVEGPQVTTTGGNTRGESSDSKNVTVLNDLSAYKGASLEEQVASIIEDHDVVMFSKTHCPFCRDAKDLLAVQLGVPVHVVEINEHPDGALIFEHLREQTEHKTVPMIYIKGNFIGGCDDLKGLHAKGTLEQTLLKGVEHTRPRFEGTDQLETARLLPPPRSRACHPLFFFPNVVNNYAVRVIGFQTFVLSILSAAFWNKKWGRYTAAFVLADFCLRFVAGASASACGMIANVATSKFKPQFRPGPPKQFASFCGIMFSGFGTLFYFVDFDGHEYLGMVFMIGLAGASFLEWAFDFCLGCEFFAIGIYLGLIPDHVYRIYTSTRQEVEESWEYKFTDSNAPEPVKVNTDPSSAIALKYKKKSDEWTKDDFHLIRNMQVSYFSMPLAINGLAVAFKMASSWSTSRFSPLVLGLGTRSIIVDDSWHHVISFFGAMIFLAFLALYAARAVFYFHKVQLEWDSPLASPSFGMITITIMLLAFLLYDEVEFNNNYPSLDEEPAQKAARVFFWMGSILHVILTVTKFGEWIGRRMEMEHVHAHWLILPVGLSVAALVAPVIPFFAADNSDIVGLVFVGTFFQSFAQLMWLVLFTITFFKTVTTHNSDNRVRHGIWVWLAAPCVVGLADFPICIAGAGFSNDECAIRFSSYYFAGIFIFFGIVVSSLPHLAFMGNDSWGMHYWIGCFSLDVLAACGAAFYSLTGFRSAETLSFMFLVIASFATFVNFLHTMFGMLNRRTVFTPEVKWGPLSFMKLTHEAFRGNMETMRISLEVLDVNTDSAEMRDNLSLFAVHLNRFSILHDEHSKHEDEVIFKMFNDWFPEHAKKYNNDHDGYHRVFEEVNQAANQLLDSSLSLGVRQDALDVLKRILPPFFDDFEEHLRGEEDNLVCIGRKHIPLELQKQMSRKVFEITEAERWNIIIPFVLQNLTRHPQRVRYLKVLMWALPERAQQIGMIVYRNVDAVMWERLRVQVPEMIPRGAHNWMRYY